LKNPLTLSPEIKLVAFNEIYCEKMQKIIELRAFEKKMPYLPPVACSSCHKNINLF